jgi:Uma2 family endonuclease
MNVLYYEGSLAEGPTMTMTESTRAALEARYYQAALDYLHSLPLEHFMESTPHSTQRKITLESLDLLVARRPDVHVYNELLVQYSLPRRKKLGQVVPDNMVVIHDGPIDVDLSYGLPLVNVHPFWMLEYVSKNNKRKDYVDNLRRYERELKVPYYLLFDYIKQKLILYRHDGKHYVALEPNARGRLELAELDLEMAILDGWVRYWYKGKLLPLPADLQKDLDTAIRRADRAESRAEAAERENAELRKQLDSLRSKKNGKH